MKPPRTVSIEEVLSWAKEELEDGHGTDWGTPSDIAVYKLLLAFVKDQITSAYEADKFKAMYPGLIAQLRVAMRKDLNSTLDRIGADHGGPE